MTDNLPDVVRDEPREIARADTDSWTGVAADVFRLADRLSSTEFVPRAFRDNPPAVAAAVLYGREAGLPPMTSLTSIHVVEGRPSMSAEAMRALVFAAGHEIEVVESTGAVCRVRARRRGSERWTPEVVWTWDAAKAAGLTGKTNWQKYPRRMLQARATSELCELHFPDVVMGFRSVEEMQDVADTEAMESGAEPSTTVQRAPRKRAAAKKATPPAPSASRPDAAAGPPLPGEVGYDDPAETSTDGDVGEAPSPSADTSSTTPEQSTAPDVAEGQPTTPTADAGEAAPAAPEPSSEDGDDIHDAEIVEDDPPAAPPASTGQPGRITRAQQKLVLARLGELGVTDAERHAVASRLVGREIDSFNNLTKREGSWLIETLALVKDRDGLAAVIHSAGEAQS